MRGRLGVAVVGAVALITGALIGWVAHRSPNGASMDAPRGPRSTEAVVPQVVGLALHDASKRLSSAGLAASVLSPPATAGPMNHVVVQDPSAGTVVGLGTTIRLEVSPGTAAFIDGLRGQIEWDKSHLLDCWTAIVRLLDRSEMRAIFATSRTASLARAARDGSSLGRYVRRCAADAVP